MLDFRAPRVFFFSAKSMAGTFYRVVWHGALIGTLDGVFGKAPLNAGIIIDLQLLSFAAYPRSKNPRLIAGFLVGGLMYIYVYTYIISIGMMRVSSLGFFFLRSLNFFLFFFSWGWLGLLRLLRESFLVLLIQSSVILQSAECFASRISGWGYKTAALRD